MYDKFYQLARILTFRYHMRYHIYLLWYKLHHDQLSDWSLITGKGGLQNVKITGLKHFCATPQAGGNLLCPPPVWLKLQAPMLKLPQNCLCLPTPFSMAKMFSVPPLCRGKTLLALPLPLCSPPPPPPLPHYQ